MSEIIVKGGKLGTFVAIVDKRDFKHLSRFCWYWHDGYARRLVWKGSAILMHREILGANGDELCDHINGNRMDNRRDNLRIATRTQNSQNQKIRSDNSSGYKGVSWSSRNKKWMAQIQVNKKKIHIGYFGLATDAANAYDSAAREHFGEFAKTNGMRE